jgi:hypothetical protein
MTVRALPDGHTPAANRAAPVAPGDTLRHTAAAAMHRNPENTRSEVYP